MFLPISCNSFVQLQTLLPNRSPIPFNFPPVLAQTQPTLLFTHGDSRPIAQPLQQRLHPHLTARGTPQQLINHDLPGHLPALGHTAHQVLPALVLQPDAADQMVLEQRVAQLHDCDDNHERRRVAGPEPHVVRGRGDAGDCFANKDVQVWVGGGGGDDVGLAGEGGLAPGGG